MPPTTRPSGGMITSATSDETILPKAAPITTPTARSTTLPREMKSRNSLTMLMGIPWLEKGEDQRRLGERVDLVRKWVERGGVGGALGRGGHRAGARILIVEQREAEPEAEVLEEGGGDTQLAHEARVLEG